MSSQGELSGTELLLTRVLFVAAALWNFAGAIPGYFDSAGAYTRMFGGTLDHPTMLAIYRGGWAAALVFGIGYLTVALRPIRHTGIVLIGILGKLLFAADYLTMYQAGLTTSLALTIVAGDLMFTALFALFLFRVKRLELPIL